MESTFREYALARDQTLMYLKNPDAVTAYLAAIGHWEVFLSHAYQAYRLLARNQKILFKQGDGSILERLNLLYNWSKHAEKAIEAGQLPAEGTLAVGLTNNDLRSADSRLTYDEMAEMLEELARWSDAAQDPSTMREKILQYYERAKEDADGTGSLAGTDSGP